MYSTRYFLALVDKDGKPNRVNFFIAAVTSLDEIGSLDVDVVSVDIDDQLAKDVVDKIVARLNKICPNASYIPRVLERVRLLIGPNDNPEDFDTLTIKQY